MQILGRPTPPVATHAVAVRDDIDKLREHRVEGSKNDQAVPRGFA
jgi:hypothetical protein